MHSLTNSSDKQAFFLTLIITCVGGKNVDMPTPPPLPKKQPKPTPASSKGGKAAPRMPLKEIKDPQVHVTAKGKMPAKIRASCFGRPRYF